MFVLINRAACLRGALIAAVGLDLKVRVWHGATGLVCFAEFICTAPLGVSRNDDGIANMGSGQSNPFNDGANTAWKELKYLFGYSLEIRICLAELSLIFTN